MPERRKKKNLRSTKHHVARGTRKAPSKTAMERKRSARVKRVAGTKPSQPKEGSFALIDAKGKTLETIVLDPLFLGKEINTNVIYQAVLMYRAGEREGTAATKDRGHVRGGGKKPWKQKGTGQARHGSRRSPIWRGGGVTFGPMPRDYSYQLPREIRRQAIVQGIKDKVSKSRFFMVQQLQLPTPKTKQVAEMMDRLKLEKPLFLVENRDGNFMMASRNIQGVSVKTAAEVNAMDLVSHKECVLTHGAYEMLLQRLKS